MNQKNVDKIIWSLLIMAYGSLFSMGLADNTRGPAYPMILSSYGIGTDQGSLIFSLSSLSGLLINITSRWWLPFLGPQKGIQVALVFMMMGSVGTGLSLTAFSPLMSLYLSSFILGLGVSGCGVSMNLLVAEGTPLEYRRQGFAGLHSTYGISSLLAPFFLSTSLHFGLSWSKHFLLVGMVPVIFLLLNFAIKQKDKIETSQKKSLSPPVNLGTRIMFGTLFGSYVASEVLISSRLVVFLEKSEGYDLVSAGNYLALFFFFLMLGRLSFAIIKVPLKTTSLLFLSLGLTLISFFVGYYIHPLGLSLTGLTMSFFFPIGMSWLGELFDRDVDFMTMTAMTSIGVTLIGMHFIFGQISNFVGLRNALLMAPFLSIVAMTSLFLLRNFRFFPKTLTETKILP